MARSDFPNVALAIGEELGRKEWNPADLRRATGSDDRKPLDRGTVETLCRGETWPRSANRARIEKALGWDIGWMDLIRRGMTLTELRELRGDVIEVRNVLRDPRSHSLADATDAELEAETSRRRAGA